MQLRTIFLPLALGAVALTAACGGGGTTGNSCTGNTGLPMPTVQLVYPAPGATGVPDATTVLVYAAPSPQSILLLSGGNLQVTVAPTALPSPLPTPNVSPPAGTNVYAVSLTTASGMLAVSSPYTVSYLFNNGCGPSPQQFGSFTTL